MNKTFTQASVGVAQITSASELLNAALNTVQVGSKLLVRKVLLLPAVHNQFQTYAIELQSNWVL